MIAVLITPPSIAKSTTNVKEAISITMHDSMQVIIRRRYGEPYCGPRMRRMLRWWNHSRPAMIEVRMRLLIVAMQIVIAVGSSGVECWPVRIGIPGAE